MKRLLSTLAVIQFLWKTNLADAKTWLVDSSRIPDRTDNPERRCGKNYMATLPPSPPGGKFPVPAKSNLPLLAFHCAPAIRPYLEEDATTPATLLIDTPIVYDEIDNSHTIDLPPGPLDQERLDVTLSLNGIVLAHVPVPLDAAAFEIPFSLAGITPQMAPHNLLCEAIYSPTGQNTIQQRFNASTALSVLPNPSSGSVTKMDLRTGALLAKPPAGIGGDYQPVFPIGYYTQFDQYLAKNLTIIDELKQQG